MCVPNTLQRTVAPWQRVVQLRMLVVSRLKTVPCWLGRDPTGERTPGEASGGSRQEVWEA